MEGPFGQVASRGGILQAASIAVRNRCPIVRRKRLIASLKPTQIVITKVRPLRSFAFRLPQIGIAVPSMEIVPLLVLIATQNLGRVPCDAAW
jgi:hypothetical protein